MAKSKVYGRQTPQVDHDKKHYDNIVIQMKQKELTILSITIYRRLEAKGSYLPL